MADKRALSAQACYILALVPPMALAGGLRVLFGVGLLHTINPVIFWLSVAPVLAWMIAWVWMAWRRTDETAQAAHKFAWFWGGGFGAAIGMLALEINASPGLHLLSQGPHGLNNPTGLLMMGALVLVIFQVAGYLLAWGSWWAAKR